MRGYVVSIFVVAAAMTIPAAQAAQRSESHPTGTLDAQVLANLNVRVLATPLLDVRPDDVGPATLPDGASRTINRLTFPVGLNAFNEGPDTAQRPAYGLDLPAGLHWQAGQTDPDCTFTTSAANCQAAGPIAYQNGAVAAWHVTADAPGTYVIKVHISSPTPDPDTSDNSASGNLVVQQPVVAKAAKVPPRPKAGSVVRVRVLGITAGGDPIMPTDPACKGSIGGKTLRGVAATKPGTVTCAYRTPRSAKSKRLRGTVSFTAGQKQIQRRFAVTLR
jgi:hypothetical protein